MILDGVSAFRSKADGRLANFGTGTTRPASAPNNQS
jgi:hypothetical protein